MRIRAVLKGIYSQAFVWSAAGLVLFTVSAHGQVSPEPAADYILIVKRGQIPADVASAHGLTIRHAYTHAVHGFAATIPSGRIEALMKDPRVTLMELDRAISISAQTVPMGLKRISATESGVAKIDGFDERVDVDIAILDTGVDATHPDLNVVQAVTFVPKDRSGGVDAHGHGTHVAGIAAALDNDFGVVGVAPGARVWSVRIFDASGEGTVSTAIKGLDYVAQNASQISVANMSFVFDGFSGALQLAISNTVAKGVVCVAAAGNASKDVYGLDGLFGTADDIVPACYPEVITVSAMCDYDGGAGGGSTLVGVGGRDDTLAGFSNFGKKVELAAPGAAIYSTLPMIQGGYGSLSGTSMACPHVTGAVAIYTSTYGRATNAAGVELIRQAMIRASEPQAMWGPADTLDRDPVHEPLLNLADGGYQQPKTGSPSISILSPEPGTRTSCAVALLAQVADPGATNLSVNVVWLSSIDGIVGVGNNFTTNLSVGTHTLSASVTNAEGLSASTNVTIVIQPTPAAGWRQAWFRTENSTGSAADSADPDGDGIPNLLERAFDLDPTTPDHTGRPMGGVSAGRLTLTYRRSHMATDLRFQVVKTADLVSWSTNGVIDVLVSSESTYQTRTATFPVADEAYGFLRLDVISAIEPDP